MLFIFLTAILPLRAQLVYDDIYSSYANPYENLLDELNTFDYGTNEYGILSPFAELNNPFATNFNSNFSPAGDFLTNKFGASYAGGSSNDWLDLPYSNPQTALKIPVGNGTLCLLLIAGLYVLTVFWRLRVKPAMTGKTQ
ncbi:hypothetical protein AGMMS50262_20050 [Bacteroidia bacterium]|nr:hypothetical protein AGMMS50262_20050 [Bacteroidia bacterium]